VVETRPAPLSQLFTPLVTLGFLGAQGRSRFLLGQAGVEYTYMKMKRRSHPNIIPSLRQSPPRERENMCS
jgi:hypothetical protein